MGAVDVVHGVISRFAARDYQGLRGLLADDFQFDNGRGMSMSREQWIGFLELMRQGFPDIDYHLEHISDDGQYFTVRSQITGTHQGSLDLSMMGVGVIPATGVAVTANPEDTIALVEGDQVRRIDVHYVDGGGIPGILAQIGVSMG